MNKMAILLIIIGLIGAIFTAKGFFTQENIHGEESFPSESIDNITIESDLANVKILPSDSNDIEVKWKGSLLKSNLNKNNVSIEEKSSELVITIGGRKLFNFSFFGFGFFNKREVEIYLPEKRFQSITLYNDVGNATISSISVDHLIAETSVSNLTIKDIQANMIRAKSDVGIITVDGFGGNLFAKSNVGNININTDTIAADMELESDVGNINLSVPLIPDNVSFHTESDIGTVQVFGEKGSYYNKQAAFSVTMETSVGNIKVKALE